MKYRIRSGVVSVSLCDQYLLIAADAVREYCPYVTKLNETAFYIFEKLKNGYSFESLCEAIQEDFDTEDEDIESIVTVYLNQLEENGYILREEE